MKKSPALYAFLCILPLLILACGPLDRHPTGYDEGGFNQEVYTTYVYAETGMIDTWTPAYSNNGKSRKLAVGTWGGYNIRCLLMFDVGDVPKQIPIKNITDCQLRLFMEKRYQHFNDNIYNQGNVTIEAHRLQHGFWERKATWITPNGTEDWNGGEYGPAINSVTVGDTDERGKWVSLDITAAVLDWLAAPSDNKGLALTAHNEGQSQAIKEFCALNTWDKDVVPRIVINYTSGPQGRYKKRLEVGVQKDCTIGFNTNDPLWTYSPGFDNFLCVGAFDGYTRRSYLKFDLSEGATGIPSNAAIVWAQLRLWYWPEGRSEGHRLKINRLTWDWKEDDDIGYLRTLKMDIDDTVNTRQIWKQPPGYQNFVINKVVQKWVDGTNPNYGLCIRNLDETKEEGFCYFASREYSDPEKRPLLTIKYTVPPGSAPPTAMANSFQPKIKSIAVQSSMLGTAKGSAN